MAKNATTVVDDDVEVSEDVVAELQKAKDEVEISQETDETTEAEETEEQSEETSGEEGKTDDSQEEVSEEASETSDEETSDFVKEFPNIKGDTPGEYARNLETAYRESFQEGVRLNNLLKEKEPEAMDETRVPDDPRLLYVDRMVQQDIQTTYDKFRKEYTQVNDPVEYQKFTDSVREWSQFYISKNQAKTAGELYTKAAIELGWDRQSTVSDKEKLGVALKDNAASSKTVSATKKTGKSKVTDQMIALNRVMYPNKSDTEIREELEIYVK